MTGWLTIGTMGLGRSEVSGLKPRALSTCHDDCLHDAAPSEMTLRNRNV